VYPILGTNCRVVAGFSAEIPPAAIFASRLLTVRLEVSYDLTTHDWWIDQLSLVSTRGQTPITTEGVREVPVAQALYVALHSMRGVVKNGRGDWYEGGAPRLHDQRKEGPTPENLDHVAEIARVSRLLRDSPAVAIQEAFGVPPRTAAHWLMLARERGHLGAIEGDDEAGWVTDASS
jgi:hypothetical protein